MFSYVLSQPAVLFFFTLNALITGVFNSVCDICTLDNSNGCRSEEFIVHFCALVLSEVIHSGNSQDFCVEIQLARLILSYNPKKQHGNVLPA